MKCSGEFTNLMELKAAIWGLQRALEVVAPGATLALEALQRCVLFACGQRARDYRTIEREKGVTYR